MGLVTPEIRPYRREGEAGVLRFVAERCPDFVIVFPTWFPELTARRDLLAPVYRVRLERNVASGGPEMACYRLLPSAGCLYLVIGRPRIRSTLPPTHTRTCTRSRPVPHVS